MYVYFETSGKCYCKYTISVDDANIPDFTRTARTGKAGNVSTEHEYQILGLVPGMKNYITLAMYNSDDELSEKQTFSIDIPALIAGNIFFLLYDYAITVFVMQYVRRLRGKIFGNFHK